MRAKNAEHAYRPVAVLGWPCLPLLSLLLWAAACTSPERAHERASADLEEPVSFTLGSRPWPDFFEGEALLLARQIEIEGPPGLLEHAVLQQDPARAVYTTKAVGDALMQQLMAKPDVGGPVRAHLDNWTLVAEERLIVVRRAADQPVIVRARGNAVWRSVATGEERRGPELDFTARPPASANR